MGSNVFSAIATILLTGISLALVMTVYSQAYAQTVGPYEVIVYEHVDYIGNSRSWKLEPGMRQKLVHYVGNDMNDRISSMQVGSKVAVMVFQDVNFGYIEGNWSLGHQFPKNFNDTIFYDSTRRLGDFFNDTISSLIVFQKEWLQPIGVMVSDRGNYDSGDLFFPLPEALSQTEAKHNTMPGMNDDANEVTLFPRDPKSPVYGKVQVTLYEHAGFKGRWITLPGADGSIPPGATFKLHPYQFDDTASSLVVRWVGPVMLPVVGAVIHVQPPSPGRDPSGAPSSVRVTAPPSPTVTLEINLDRPGMDRYRRLVEECGRFFGVKYIY